MRVTIVPEDHLIIRDDVVCRLEDWPFTDNDIHAIQFLDGKGEIELKGPPHSIKSFTGTKPLARYLKVLDAWIAKQPQEEAESEISDPS